MTRKGHAMKSLRFPAVFAIIPALLLLLAAPAAAGTVLRMNHQLPAAAVGSTVDQWFADEVEKRTNGNVVIRIFWDNGLGDPADNLHLLRDGLIDMAAMSAGYFPEDLALFAAPNSIPMGMDDVCQSAEIMHALTETIPGFAKEAAENGVRPLFFHLLNPYLLVTKAKVTSLKDLSGMRIRTWGEDMPRLVRAAGAEPVNLFLPDIRQALEAGVIDGCPFSVDLVVSYKLYEVARNVTEVVMWEGPSWGLWISEAAWSRLTPEERSIFMETAREARKRELPLTRAAEKEARAILKKAGVSFHAFPPGELKKWKANSPDFFADLVDRLEKQDKGDSARKMVDLWKQLRRKVSCP